MHTVLGQDVPDETKTQTHTKTKKNPCAHLHLQSEQNLMVAAAAKHRAAQQNVRGLEPTWIIAEAKIGANRNRVHDQIIKVRVVDLKL